MVISQKTRTGEANLCHPTKTTVPNNSRVSKIFFEVGVQLLLILFARTERIFHLQFQKRTVLSANPSDQQNNASMPQDKVQKTENSFLFQTNLAVGGNRRYAFPNGPFEGGVLSSTPCPKIRLGFKQHSQRVSKIRLGCMDPTNGSRKFGSASWTPPMGLENSARLQTLHQWVSKIRLGSPERVFVTLVLTLKNREAFFLGADMRTGMWATAV